MTETKRQFYKRNKGVVRRVIRGFLAKNPHLITHGGRAQNVQLPRFLKRPTDDWDIFSKTPKKSAIKLEKKLDKKFKGDYFRVKEGATKKLNVQKVISNTTDKGVADFALADRFVQTIAKRGKRFATLKDQVEKAKSNLKNPSAEFRREKDLNLIRRIKQFEKLRGKKI